MIIPIRCFTCGQVLASKYKKFQELMYSNNLVLSKKRDGSVVLESKDNTKSNQSSQVITMQDRKKALDQFMEKIDKKEIEFTYAERHKTPTNVEALILKQIGLKRYCCKRHLIGHVDILDKL